MTQHSSRSTNCNQDTIPSQIQLWDGRILYMNKSIRCASNMQSKRASRMVFFEDGLLTSMSLTTAIITQENLASAYPTQSI
jgi:hypothetical protein